MTLQVDEDALTFEGETLWQRRKAFADYREWRMERELNQFIAERLEEVS